MFSRMPGARHLRTPVISSTDAASDATSMKLRPSSQMSVPMPVRRGSDDIGVYMNHPAAGAALKNSDPQTKTPPVMKHQKLKDDSRGNGSSRVPRMPGSSRIATASKIGTANRNIIAVPWSVNSWL